VKDSGKKEERWYKEEKINAGRQEGDSVLSRKHRGKKGKVCCGSIAMKNKKTIT